jgi:FixJ family two-component response regulator
MIIRSSAAEPAEIPGDDVLAKTPIVFVVDPDPVTGKTVQDLLQGYELTVQVYPTARGFFAAYTGDQPGCLVLEQRIPDISGLQIQRRLTAQNQPLPLVYVSSTWDVSTAVALMRGGAIHVLEKPLRAIELLDAVQEALAKDQNERRQRAGKCRVRESIAMLTLKERQLVSLIASTKSTKAIIAELGICARAVELRRHGIMNKLGLRSSLELLKFAMLAGRECSHSLDSAELPADADYGWNVRSHLKI